MYDAIVVGARAAGAPTAMLLARKGHRVLAIDRATFPSDTMSTHILAASGAAMLKRWGLLEALQATGAPALGTVVQDFGELRFSGTPLPMEGVSDTYAPRRTYLDKMLVDAARSAGAEVREDFIFESLLRDAEGRVCGIRGRHAGGATVEEHAHIVVGADGRRSLVAYFAGAEEYNTIPARSCVYYSYWRGAHTGNVACIYRTANCAVYVMPTNDDEVMVALQWGIAAFPRVRKDIEGAFAAVFAEIPELAATLRSATRTERFVGTSDLPNFFRKPYGNGWALVGDAGYHKDPILGQGLSDAFHDADSLANAIDSAFRWEYDMETALAAHHRARDARVGPMYRLVTSLARMDAPSADAMERLAAMQGQQEHIDRFISVGAGTLPVDEFYNAENFARIAAGARSVAA